MDLLEKIPDELIRRIGEEKFLYVYLIADIDKESYPDKEVYSENTVEYITETFEPIEQKHFDSLETEGIIKIIPVEDEHWISIGFRNKRNQKVLYSKKSPEPENNLLLTKVDEYYGTLTTLLKRSRKSPTLAMHSYEVVERFLLNKDEEEFNARDLMLLFESMYYLVIQSQARKPMSKEYGQIKKLSSLYLQEQAVSIIAQYLMYSERYSGNAVPSIGGMLYNKDKVVNDIEKPKRQKSDETKSERF